VNQADQRCAVKVHVEDEKAKHVDPIKQPVEVGNMVMAQTVPQVTAPKVHVAVPKIFTPKIVVPKATIQPVETIDVPPKKAVWRKMKIVNGKRIFVEVKIIQDKLGE